jgi:hypothetical protein
MNQSGAGQVSLGNTPVRVWHRTRGFGEETSETAFGAHGAIPFDSGVLMLDGQLRFGNSDTDLSTNFGLGYRLLTDDLITGNPHILGASVWYDGEDTQLNNYFNQVGVSLERLGETVDLRLNANIPTDSRKLGDDVVVGTTPIFSGNILGVQTLTQADVPLRVVDFEGAHRIADLNAWLYGGGYEMDGDDVSEFGYKAGARAYLYNDLVLDVGVTDDDLFGTNTVVQVIWTPGRTTPGLSSWSHRICDRYREQVYRNTYVATRQIEVSGAQALTDADGNDIRVVHVDSTAAAGGDGSFEKPLNMLTSIQGNSQQGDIVFVHSGSSFTGQSATIQDEQRFLGEGNNIEHAVATTQLGSVNLPASAPGAGAGPIPVIMNAAGDAVILAGGNDDVSNLSAIEVANFHIDGGARGVASPTGVGAVNIHDMLIENTTGNGIDLTELNETLADNSMRARLNATIADVTFDNVGGDDIHVDGDTTQTTQSGTVSITDYTSTNGDGVGIALVETNRAVTITNLNWNGGATGEGALLIQDAPANSAVTMNGTNTITGGKTAPADTEGYAIRIQSSAATHNITGTTITNTGGDSVQINGGSANLNFTGRITKSNNSSVFFANGGHTGSVTFREATADAGVIDATGGDGLQFNNADGVYTFVDEVNLHGGDAGIDIDNGSAASIVLQDGLITDPTGNAVDVNGGTASLDFTGKITKSNAGAAVNVIGGHTGTLNFNELDANTGVITATAGTGLQFNNADGAYNFNDNVTLNGGDAGVDVLAGSSGTFTFADMDITNPTGSAVNINASNAIFTVTAGDIATNSATNEAIRLNGNTGGSITFASGTTITGTGGLGILSQNNTNLTALFAGAVDLNNSTTDAVQISGNTSGSTTFSNLDIATPTGSAIEITNSNTNFTHTAGSITANNAANEAILLSGNTGGTVTFASGTTITGTGSKGILSQNNANLTANFAGAVDLNNITGHAVQIAGNTSGSTTFSNLDIMNPTAGSAVIITGSNTNFTHTAGSITSNSGSDEVVELSGNTGGNYTFASGTTINATAGRGILVQNNTGGSALFAGAVDLNTGTNNGVTITGNTGGGSTRFNDLDITTTGGVGFTATAAATGNHTVTVAGTGNTITTTGVGGVGLNLDTITVGASGVNFDSVSVNGAANGIVVNNVVGGAVTIGAQGVAAGDGGTIQNTTGDGVTITNAANVSLNHMIISNAGAQGVDYAVNTSAASRLTLNGNTISGAANETVRMTIDGSASLANISVRGNNISNTSDDEALLLTTTGATLKTVNLLVDSGNTITNDSAAAPAASFQVGTSTNLNATVLNNQFSNTNAAPGRPFDMNSLTASSTIRLNLNGNTATATSGNGFFLTETAGAFTELDVANVATNNTGGVTLTGTITDDAGPIPTP